MSDKTIFKRSKKFETIEDFITNFCNYNNDFNFKHCYISYNYQEVLNDVEESKRNGVIDNSNTIEFLNAGNIYIAIA